MLAGLVARDQFQGSQRQARRVTARRLMERFDRIERKRAARRLGGEEEDLVESGPGHALSSGKIVPSVLPMPVGACAINGLRHAPRDTPRRQLALPAAELAMRKLQGAERGVARGAVRLFLHGPVEEALALLDEENLQLTRGVRFDQHRFLLAADIEVDQRDRQFGEPAGAAQQIAVHLRLRPVQRAVIGGHPFERAAIGLDLFQPVRSGIVAVGAAAHGQAAMRAGQRDLGFIAAGARPATVTWPADAFQRGRRGREAQIEVAAPGRELAQRAHGDDVGHVRASAAASFVVTGVTSAVTAASTPIATSDTATSSSAHRTSSTRTGMPCCAQ